MGTAGRTPADLLHLLLKALPNKKLADLELVRAPGKPLFLLLTVAGIDCDA